MATRILCIEDEFFISELYTRALQKAGYEVTVALNGDDGLELARTNRYDVILLDLMVPGMNGTHILAHLRAPDSTVKSKIIITTNLEQDEHERQEMEKLADGYLIKADITPKELADFLETIAPSHSTNGAAPPAPAST